jgi:hypothetical protein
MTYWNEISDTHIRYWDTREALPYYRVKDEMSEEGYRGDKLQPSKVVYLGTCDVMSSLNKENIWTNMVRNELHPDQPLIAMGSLSSCFPSSIRRLYSFIQNFGAPELVYLSLARFDSYEYVNKSGKCYSLSSRKGTADFCKNNNMIDDEEHIIWTKQIEATTQLSNKHNNRYILEEKFTFLEMICKVYNIKLKWTFNPTDACIKVLYHNLELFEDISPFMKESFVGSPLAKDHLPNRTIGLETHKELYNKFTGNEGWDFEQLCKTATVNFEWASARYQKKMILDEDL